MRLEQRIGRVDRIGQTHCVRALNFVFEDTVEYRVREVLEEKLAVILNEFGVDKTGDVLDSAQAGQLFDDLYIETLINPESLDTKVEAVVSRVEEQVKAARESAAIYQTSDQLDATEAQQLIDHPIPHWVERMTVKYLEAHGGKAKKNGQAWNLTWSTGEHVQNIVFTVKDAEANASAHHLTLEEEATQAFERVWESAVIQGKNIYKELVQQHREQLDKEPEKGEYAFNARHRAIERIGLPQVRDYRLAQLTQEERAWREQLNQAAEVNPELVPLLLIRLVSI